MGHLSLALRHGRRLDCIHWPPTAAPTATLGRFTSELEVIRGHDFRVPARARAAGGFWPGAEGWRGWVAGSPDFGHRPSTIMPSE